MLYHNGNVDRFGYPFSKNLYKNYYSVIDNELLKNIDVVLIDGRFRVECCLLCVKYADQNTTILIHDYERNWYHVVEKYVNKEDMIGTLVKLSIKKEFDRTSLEKDLIKYENDPR